MQVPSNVKMIKSAQRVIEVFQYFSGIQEDATVMDIARAMNYPQSSTSELLSFLAHLGYLHQDRYARTYRPTAQVALLGARVQPRFFREGRLLPMIDDLVRQTKLTVVLGTRVGPCVQYIHVVRPDGAAHGPVENGQAPLLHSALGTALLATYNREAIKKLAHRLNAEAEPELRVSPTALFDSLEAFRANRHALRLDEAGGALVATLLPRDSERANPPERLAIGLWGPADVVTAQTSTLVRAMRSRIAKTLLPVAAVATPTAQPAVQPMPMPPAVAANAPAVARLQGQLSA